MENLTFQVFLGLHEMKEQHTAENVKKAVNSLLGVYQLNDDHVCLYFSDNGSNLLKAYKVQNFLGFWRYANFFIQNDLEEVYAYRKKIGNTQLEDEIEDALSGEDGFEEESNEDGDDLQEEVDEDEDVESNACRATEQNGISINGEVYAFDQLESQFLAKFGKRKSDPAHDANIVLRTTVDKSQYSTVVNEAKNLANKFKKSHVATSSLLKKTNLTILMPGQTRWASHYIFLKRFLSISQSINEVAVERGWASLSEVKLNKMRVLETLLEPFYDFLLSIQKENNEHEGLSKLYFKVRELVMKLGDVKVQICLKK